MNGLDKCFLTLGWTDLVLRHFVLKYFILLPVYREAVEFTIANILCAKVFHSRAAAVAKESSLVRKDK